MILNSTEWKSPAGTIEASVLIAGIRCPFYRRHDGRPFTAGIPGTAYTIGVRNMSPVRIEVIATVDGRHVLRDEPGDAHASQGLVIPAGGWHEFPGWQFDNASAGQFTFAGSSASVAAMATGSAANTGVIGFAVHRERHVPSAGYATADVMPRGVRPVAVAAAGGGSLGTGIGVLVYDGQWIIKGIRNEFYPCADDVFRETYEPAGEAQAESVSRDLSCARCAPADSVADHPDDCRCGGCDDARRDATAEDEEDAEFLRDAATLDSDFEDGAPFAESARDALDAQTLHDSPGADL
jgi:ribosomal protein S27AE